MPEQGRANGISFRKFIGFVVIGHGVFALPVFTLLVL